jgi:hypothetical protein
VPPRNHSVEKADALQKENISGFVRRCRTLGIKSAAVFELGEVNGVLEEILSEKMRRATSGGASTSYDSIGSSGPKGLSCPRDQSAAISPHESQEFAAATFC